VYAYGLNLSNECEIYFSKFSKGILLPFQLVCHQCQPCVAISEWRGEFVDFISLAFRFYFLKSIITRIYVSRKNWKLANFNLTFLEPV
jgi:hypothetical protein